MNEVFYRQSGVGNSVICIHGSLSSSRQWQPLTDALSDRYEVFSPDLFGYGKSPIWPGRSEMTVDDEVDLLAPVFVAAKDELNIIGHSWGGAVAIKAALKSHKKLKSLILFEPALWSLLATAVPDSSATREILEIHLTCARDMQSGNWKGAAESFLKYWAGPDIWQKMNEKQRADTVAGMPAVRNNWHGSFSDSTSFSAVTSIDAPVLLLTGSKSPCAARVLVELIASALKNANVVEIDGAGHMGPITHSSQVNQTIADFLQSANQIDCPCGDHGCAA